jgi:hypothetical protein
MDGGTVRGVGCVRDGRMCSTAFIEWSGPLMRLTAVELRLTLGDGFGRVQVTARNLVKIDLEGHKVEASPYTVNTAGR